MLSFDESVIVAAILFIFVPVAFFRARRNCKRLRSDATQEIFDDRRYAGTARASSA